MSGSTQSYLEGLNEEQRQVVLHLGGPAAVFAGPGSGKTKTLVARLLHLLKTVGIPGKNIVVTTFTRKAAGELRERVMEKVSEDSTLELEAADLQIGTIHSLCLTLLRRFGHLGNESQTNPVALEENDLLLFLSVHADELGLGHRDQDKLVKETGKLTRSKRDQRALNHIGFLGLMARTFSVLSECHNSEGVLMAPDVAGPISSFVLDRYKMYISLTTELGVLDHSLILRRAHLLVSSSDEARKTIQSAFTHYLIDEFQDTNSLQDSIFALLANDREELMVVGDEDQAVYGFRGARVELFRTFARRWKGKQEVRQYLLQGNYRSTKPVIQHINSFKESWPSSTSDDSTISNKRSEGKRDGYGLVGRIVRPDSESLAESILQRIRGLCRSRSIASFSDVAILYRSDVGITGKTLTDLRDAQRSRFRDVPLGFSVDSKMLRNDSIRTLLELFARIADRLDLSRASKRQIPKSIEQGVEKLIAEGVASTAETWIKERETSRQQVFVHRILSALIRNPPFAENLPDGSKEFAPSNLTTYLAKLSEEASRFDRVVRSRFRGGAATIRSFLRYVAEADQSVEPLGKADAVQILSIHRAKGLEWPVVFILNPDEPSFAARSPDSAIERLRARVLWGPTWESEWQSIQEDESRRLLYVAQSRARSIVCYAYTEQSVLPTFLESSVAATVEWSPLGEHIPIQTSRLSHRKLNASHTDLVNHETCSLRYLMEKVFRFEGRPLPHLYEGKSVHRALQVLHEDIRSERKRTEAEYRHVFDQSWIRFGQSVSRSSKRKSALFEIFARYVRDVERHLGGASIAGIESDVCIDIPHKWGRIAVMGRVDLVLEDRATGHKTLVEFKLSTSDGEDVETDLQLLIYQAALNLERPSRRIIDITSGRSSNFKPVDLVDCKKMVETRIDGLVRDIDEELFVPAKAAKTCQSCNMMDICRASKAQDCFKESDAA